MTTRSPFNVLKLHQLSCSVVLLLCLLAAAPARAQLTQDQKDALLNAHNEFRALHSLQALTWSDDLATAAQTWVDQCKWDHSDNGFGENLWGQFGGSVPSNLSVVVVSWYNEVQEYNCQSQGCSGVCGHYTQVMWADSTTVGCAIRTGCEGAGVPSIIVSCNYNPAGNVNGVRPFPLAECPGYPYFGGASFVLDVVLNTTSYSDSWFITNVNAALSLGDEQRVIILDTESLGPRLTKVQLFIVTADDSSGKDKADQFISFAQSKATQLTSRGLYVEAAGYSSGGSASSLSSWIDLL